MQVDSDRRYRFTLPPADLWPALTRVEDYRVWWPWLRRFDGTTFAPGARWTCIVQPPLPYRLGFVVRLDDVTAERSATASITGDIRGVARLEITPAIDGSELHLVSSLEPASRLLRVVSRSVQPVARFGHDWVLDNGLRQFESRALRSR